MQGIDWQENDSLQRLTVMTSSSRLHIPDHFFGIRRWGISSVAAGVWIRVFSSFDPFRVEPAAERDHTHDMHAAARENTMDCKTKCGREEAVQQRTC